MACLRASFQLEHGAVSEDDRQRLHPVARAAVLEGCCAGRVGGDDAARAGAGERRCRREPRASSPSRSCIAAIVTPGSTVMRPGRTSTIPFILVVARMTSPIGVAPPVSDDCAPTASTDAELARMSTTSAVVRGKTRPAAWPPGKWAASTSQSSVGSRESAVTVVSLSRQSESVVRVGSPSR